MSVAISDVPSKRQGLLTFYSELSAKGRRTFWACWGGYTLDAMDFMLYPLLIGTLLTALHMDRAAAGGIATVALLASALGGWAAGYLADRFGRVRTMQITIVLFSIGSLLSAFAQDATQLMICRALLGFGFGGEAAVAAVTLAEVVSSPNRGNAIGVYQTSYPVGWGVAVLIQSLAFATLDAEIAWRVMFAVGAVPALLVFFIRRNVDEPAISVAARNENSTVRLTEIFIGRNLLSTIMGSLLTVGVQGGFYALLTWLPQYLQAERKITVLGSAPYLAALIVGSFFGVLFSGWLADRFGRRPVFVLFAVASAATVYLYTALPLSGSQMFLLGLPLGFCAVGFYAPLMSCLNELYPTLCRGQGVGFCYSFGRAVGGLFPFLVGIVATTMSLGGAICAFALGSYALVAIVALLVRETKGTALAS